MLGQVGAAESIRARSPTTYEGLRAAGFIGGLTSQEDVAGLNILRAVDLIGGKSDVPTDTTDPGGWEGLRNWVRYLSAILITVLDDKLPIQASASYGLEPEIPTVSPIADLEARGAFTLRVRDTDPGEPGFDGNVDVTWLYFPSTATTPYRLFFAFGGGASYTTGRFTASVEIPAAFTILFTSPFDWGDDANLGKRLIATARYGRADAKAFSVGKTDGPHVIVESVALKLDIAPKSSARLEAKAVDLSLALSEADSFISSLSQELKTSFDIALVYDKDGLRFEGGPKRGQSPPTTPARFAAAPSSEGGTLATAIPPKATSFGPFRLFNGHVALGRSTREASTLELSTGAGVSLGPFVLTLDRIGLAAELRAGGVEPNLGLVDLNWDFKPPNGIGVAIDAKVIKGGGYLYLDPDKGEYAGVLELSFKGLTIKAVGIVNARAPVAGWSLLLLLYAEFRHSPWQLGLGFNITAVGGIMGLQHAASVEQLRAAMGSNAFDDVLFPEDPVRDAPRMIGRLRTLFPVKPQALVVGPAVEINWGTPAIVTAKLAVLAQFGGLFGAGDVRFTRLTILGTVRACAPPRDVNAPRLVDIAADVLGDYDVESGLLAIDARLREGSKLGGVEFSGSLIIRIGLGSNPAFAIAVGGFHPAFTDLPPALPARIDRLGLQWKIGSAITLTLQIYVAVTASSWQMGAAFTLVASIGPVDMDGGLSFDAIAYDDGRFSVDIAGHVRIRWHGHTLMSVSLKMVLDRNAQQVWHAAGSASFSILWWDKTVDFEHTWSDPVAVQTGPLADAGAAVRAALADPANWTAQLPRGGEGLVTLAAPSGVSLMAHPLGTLTVAQRVAPLGLALDHLDGKPVAPGTVVDITAVRVGAATLAPQPRTTLPFPRARFQELSEHQRLTQKTFEPLPAGVTITPPGQANPAGAVAALTFEPINLAPEGVTPAPPQPSPGAPRTWHTRGSLAARSPLRQGARLTPDALEYAVDVRPPEMIVADRRDLASTVALSAAEARSETLARQRATAGTIVVEAHEAMA